MERIESDRAKEEKDADRIKALEEEKQRLLCQIEDCHQSASLLKTEYEQRIQEIEQEKKDLESSLAAAQEKISELQTSLTVAKSDESSHLSQYDDTDISSLPPVGSEETISLCNVISDYSGQKWLIRFADLSHNGHYHMFHRNEELPPYFANRDKIFYKDGPSTDGFYGIWSWSAIPNEKDPSKDYIISKYNVNLDAIEIATIPEASSLEELIHLLKDGFVYQPHSRRIMFSLYASKGQYMGILCSIKELNVTNGKVSFAEDCIEVPVYEFNSDNILRLENGLSFYRNAFAGLPNKLYQLKSSLDIVKNIVFSSISWATYKTRGYTRAEYRSFKDFLGAIPVEDIVQRIEAECRCSDSVAKELLNEFLSIVWKYVDGDSLEDDVILSAISASSELQERTKALIRADWEAEHKDLLTDAQRELDLLNAKLESVNTSLTEAQEAFSKTKLEEERLSSVIAEKEKLAEDVEAAVADRIEMARKNAAGFIANMAFVDRHPNELLSDMKELLSSCDCGSACSKCLKHYRNQYVHGMLDRFAALQLLEWGIEGIKASPISPEKQISMIRPLANILKQSGCEISTDGEITAIGHRSKKKIVIYPAMWVEPHASNTVFVSDAYIKYAKPYAVQRILDNT